MLNIFYKTAPNIDISDDTGERAVEDTANTCSEHRNSLEIASLQAKELK